MKKSVGKSLTTVFYYITAGKLTSENNRKNEPKKLYEENNFYYNWLDSNFISMDSKKFVFWNFDYIMKLAVKNESEIEKLRSRDRRIFEKNRFYEIEL